MGWWKYAKPGDKVVCVRHPKYTHLPATYKHPKEGEVCVIISTDTSRLGSGILELDGYPPFQTFLGSVYPDARNFRPVKSTKTGMKILKGILNGQPVSEDA
jgi:hypothetical protein